jgi:mannitol/fructose-specific phosphotransferase system IIA component (Ntr-type)
MDTMITSLAELLEEKGVITQEEREQRIKKRLKI